MDSVRTLRLTHQLLSRQAVNYDVATKERLIFRNRSRALRKYHGKGNIFGSFTSLPKLGINPQSQYNTPTGVYSYPLDYILDKTSGDTFEVPFVPNALYLHIFNVSGIERTLKFDLDDTDKVHEFNSKATEDLDSEEYSKVRDMVLRINDYVNATIGEIPKDYWKSDVAYNTWFNKLQKATGFHYDPDDNISYIIMNEGGIFFYDLRRILAQNRFPLETVLEKVKDKMVRSVRAKTIMFPYEDRIIQLPEVQDMGMEAYFNFKNTVVLAEGQPVVCDQAFTWNCTRHLIRSNPRKWTGLMRRLGLIGAVDHNTATIHDNEPTQAVFFEPSSIKVLEVIHNELPVRSYKYDFFSKWAADVERYLPTAINSFKLSLRQFLTTGARSYQMDVFAKLSWIQQNAREFFKDHPVMLQGFIDEVNNRREDAPIDKNVLDRITRILQRLLR